ncbi:nidogen-like domain-containing protein [Ditylenchus destructor]|nr:nidogen-like domain-containing protein [Ditylenchus destructor]
MRLDPERLAARLRIEQEIEMDHRRMGRNRRQLGTPKEETIQVTAQLFSGRLFEYGTDEAGDKPLPSSLDVGKKLSLTRPISFYGKEYNTIYVLSNGGIGFDSNSRTYRANILPSNLKIIAPFWNRNDLRNGGNVFYREVTSGRVLERGQSEIRYQYDREVKVLSAIVATWVKMQPLSSEPLPDENTNTFQVALFVTTNGTFANFIYSNIGWTQGAESGFGAGDNSKHFALPTSGTGNIMYLEDYGNTGIPGEWMFILGDDRVLRCKPGIKGDTCDETCGAGEWGADCFGCCHCAGDAQCNNVTGECNSGCATCWNGGSCQQKSAQCKTDLSRPCAHNAISFTDYDRCGEPTQRCECLAGYEGKGYEECRDIDECAQSGTCHEKAVCTNTPGRFFCQCQQGFSGDGVTECIASFLYPSEGQKLPKSRNSKVAWQLKYALKIFGKERDRIMISTNGLIVVKELSRINPGDQLDDMEILGIAPFFAPIDLNGGGEVTVTETTDSDVLTRATQVVNDNLGTGETNFRATSVVTISFMNVTTPKAKAANTFQTLLIGGTNGQKESVTFAEFLYKDLLWSEGAEAGIMTIDKTNSIHLPGSGTAGIEQLSQLSNVRLPGIWLYRVDGDTVLPCMQMDLQPPYCDAQSPTLISQRRPPPVTQPATESTTISSLNTTPMKKASHETDFVIDATTQVDEVEQSAPASTAPPKPTHKKRPSSHPSSSQTSSESKSSHRHQPGHKPALFTTVAPSSSRITPAFPVIESRNFPAPGATPRPTGSTPHKPLVSIAPKDLDEMPPDVFDSMTFPPQQTVVPHLIGNSAEGGEDGGMVFNQGKSVIMPELVTTTQSQPETTQVTSDSMQPTPPKDAFPHPPSESSDMSPKSTKADVHLDDGTEIIHIDQPSETIVPSLQTTPQTNHVEESASTSTAPSTTTDSSSQPNSNEETQPPATTQNRNQLFVFSTPKPQSRPATKPKLVIGTPSSKTPKFNDDRMTTEDMSANDPNRLLESEASGNSERSQMTLRTMYGPAYQIRPMATGFAMRDKHFDGASYEEHLQKAARLSSEMSAYDNSAVAGSRLSIYGSYWNMSPTNSNQSNSPPTIKTTKVANGPLNRSALAANALAFNNHHSPNNIVTPTSANINPRNGLYIPIHSQRYLHGGARH